MEFFNRIGREQPLRPVHEASRKALNHLALGRSPAGAALPGVGVLAKHYRLVDMRHAHVVLYKLKKFVLSDNIARMSVSAGRAAAGARRYPDGSVIDC